MTWHHILIDTTQSIHCKYQHASSKVYEGDPFMSQERWDLRSAQTLFDYPACISPVRTLGWLWVISLQGITRCGSDDTGLGMKQRGHSEAKFFISRHNFSVEALFYHGLRRPQQILRWFSMWWIEFHHFFLRCWPKSYPMIGECLRNSHAVCIPLVGPFVQHARWLCGLRGVERRLVHLMKPTFQDIPSGVMKHGGKSSLNYFCDFPWFSRWTALTAYLPDRLWCCWNTIESMQCYCHETERSLRS